MGDGVFVRSGAGGGSGVMLRVSREVVFLRKVKRY